MGLPGLIGDLIKTKVKVPKFEKIDVGTETGKAISEYSQMLPEASRLASDITEFNQGSLDKTLAAKIPGFEELTSTIASNIASMAKGIIPEDVSSAIERSNAAKGIEGGFKDSEFGRYRTARDFGTTSMAIANQGMQNAMSWIASTRRDRMAPIASPTMMFLSPEQRLAHITGERDKELNRDYLSNQLKAAQSWQSAFARQMQNHDSFLTSAASSYVGKGMGGMGAGGGFGGGGGGSGFNPGATGNAGYF